jgi:hypothetical protein
MPIKELDFGVLVASPSACNMSIPAKVSAGVGGWHDPKELLEWISIVSTKTEALFKGRFEGLTKLQCSSNHGRVQHTFTPMFT